MKRPLLFFLSLIVSFALCGQSQLSVQINASDNDAEEKIEDPAQTATVGEMDVSSSDLELGSEDGDGTTAQLTGLRFTGIDIPQGAVILSASIQFAVDESKNTMDGNFVIGAEANADPAAFSSTAFDISSRTFFDATVDWTVAGGTWTNAGDAGPDQQTSDIASLIQLIVDQEGWMAGNSLVLTVSGTGTKAAESFDGDAALAPILNITYGVVEPIALRIAAGEDDLEEYIDDPNQTEPVGSIDAGSSDLELGSERESGSRPQMVGLRFRDVPLAAGAQIASAYIQFTVDEAKNADPASYTIRAQADPNAPAFIETMMSNISSRPTLDASVAWEVPAGTWMTVAEAGPDQRTADITSLIEAIIAQEGWAEGNAMVFTITGTGTRTAESFEGDPTAAAQLIINELIDPNAGPVMTVLEDCDDETPGFDEEEFELEVVGTYRTGLFDEGATEIVAYDRTSSRLFSSNANDNTVSVIDITNPANPTLVTSIDMNPYGGGLTSIDVYEGLVAVASEAEVSTANGSVVFFDNMGNFINEVEVGVLPDMVTFTPDGTKVLSANEGEPSDDYFIDPEGSISIIDVSGGAAAATVTTATFTSFNDKLVSLQNRGVRIFGPGATVAQDLEPEYIAVTDDNATAYVSLQENNALAVVDIATSTVVDIYALGFKDHNSGRPLLNEFVLNELIEMPALGTPTYGGGQPTVFLGGFSGLYFDENESTETEYVFYAIPDRGPNGDAVARATVTPEPPQNLRPFKLVDYQGRIAKFIVNLADGSVSLDEQIFLSRQDGTPISGKGNVPGFDEVPVTVAFEGGDLLFEDFQNQGLELNGFTPFSVASDANWFYDNFQDDFFAEMNGFGADVASDDWLISPAIDFAGATSATFSFESTSAFDGGDLRVLISTDYDGSSNPSGFTWTDLTEQAALSPGDNLDTPSGDIDISAFISSATYIAFQYTSTGTGPGEGRRWQIDDVRVTSPDGGPYASVDYTDADGTEYSALEYDPFGGDFEGILKDNDGNFWMCDEYRPAIYKFQPDGTMIERYVPAGTSQLGEAPQEAGFYGAETLPAVYSKRRANRGFEAIAYDSDNDIVYAFIQSPMYNPDNSTRNASDVIRILGVNAADGTPVSEYVYLLERNRDSGRSLGRVDKIGDAVYVGNGTFMVLERDSSVPGEDEGKKYVYTISLTGATNILGTALAIEDGNSGTTLEQLSADELAAMGVQAVQKTKVLNLPSIGYLPSDKPEGLAVLPNGGIAVLNDNDFGLAGAGVSDNSTLGIIEFCTDNGMDASNESEGINITNWPTLGAYQPDAIHVATVGGKTYILTANEGDARDYDGYSEEERVADLTLDATAYPDAATLQDDLNLGRLKTTSANGDYDGDGDYDQIYSYGARSFSIWDEFGNLVYDSGNEFERILADLDPENFNSTDDENQSGKNRSDDKGPEPEAIEIVTKGDSVFALIGLERQGGIMIYNISDISAPYFVNYVNNRDFSVEDVTTPEVGDLAPEDIVYIPAEDSPTGEALVVVANEISGTVTIYGAEFEEEGFVFRVIHNNDGESKLESEEVGGRLIGGAAPFKTVVDSLKATDQPHIMLSSGDNFLAGIAFNASLNRGPDQPYYDAIVLDSLGYDAICIGNHDFDFGPDVLEKMITDFQVTMPPYLSANMDFTSEPGLQALVDNGRIAARTTVDVGGEQIGVVGLIYGQVNTITSLRNVTVDAAVTSIAQQQIDELLAEGINKIILITHLQSINNELELISNLNDVDIVIAGGGDEFLTNDPAGNGLPGLTQFGPYPYIAKDAEDNDVLVVTTPGEYRYVGNLSVKFNDQGELDAVTEGSDLILVADVTPDAGLQSGVVDSVTIYAESLDQNIIARTEVDLDGTRVGVRTRETNQGNLIADAFLYLANQGAAANGLDPNIPIVAVQNGGGIRNDEIIPADSDISEKKTFDMLPFDNNLGILEPLTPAEFRSTLENAVSSVENGDGRFLQIAGFEIVWDSMGVPNESRIYDVKLADGTMIVDNGELVDGAPSVYIATNSFTADGGDDYDEFIGKDFTLLGFSYQRALFEYIIAADGANGVITAEQYPAGGEGRIRELQTVGTETLNLGELSFTASPNPFLDNFQVQYELAETGDVQITLVDLLGRTLETVVDTRQTAGRYSFDINQALLPAGTYMIKVRLDNRVAPFRVVKQ